MTIQYLCFLISFLFLTTACNDEKNRLQVKFFHSHEFDKSLLKVNPEKKLAVYLPPSYFQSKKSYPVIYYLPGYTSPIDEIIGGEYEGFKLKEVMDDLIEQKLINEMIVVLCDGSNFLGGNFYTNSPLTGNAENYIVHEIVNYIDSHYRTIASPSSRGISGHSMGGFGSLNIASKYPNIFQVCYSVSPGIYDQYGLHEHALFNDENKLNYINDWVEDVRKKPIDEDDFAFRMKKKIKALFSESYESYFSAFTIAYGAAFNYDLQTPIPHIVFPSVPSTKETSTLNEFLKWQRSGFGNWEEKILERKVNLTELNALAFDCGQDDAWITDGVKHILILLQKENISVDSFWHSGGHDDQLHLRLKNHLIPYFSNNLEFDQ